MYDVKSLENGFTIVPVIADHEVDYDGISGAGVPNPFRDNDSIQRWPLGTMLLEGGLRRWVYAKAGAVSLKPGKLLQAAVPKSGHQDMVMAAAAADATSLTVTPATVPVVVDEYNGGVIIINDGAAGVEGTMRRVKNVPAIVHTNTGVITLGDEDGLAAAVVATDTATLVRNPFYEVILHPSLPTNKVVGVPIVLITAAQYGWLCVYGEVPILTDGTITIALDVMPSNGTDGAVELWALTDGTPPVAITPAIGMVTQVNISTEYSLVHLNI